MWLQRFLQWLRPWPPHARVRTGPPADLVAARLTNQTGEDVEIVNRGRGAALDILVTNHAIRTPHADEYRVGEAPFLGAGVAYVIHLRTSGAGFGVRESGYWIRLDWRNADGSAAAACFQDSEGKAGAILEPVDCPGGG